LPVCDTPHLLANHTVDSVKANDNVSGVLRAILASDNWLRFFILDIANSFIGENLVLVVDVLVQCFQNCGASVEGTRVSSPESIN
jgi:hypothetical protein